MAAIPVGHVHEHTTLVTSEIAIDFMGLDGARVLATPFLIWNLEMACRNGIRPLLGDGFDSVGTEVNVKHLAATPLGMSARFRGEVIGVEGRKVLFRVEAWDETEKIAEGTHERFVVNKDRFAGRALAKAQGKSG